MKLPQMPVALGVGCELSDKIFRCFEYLNCAGNASIANFAQWCAEATWSSGTSLVVTCDLLNASSSNHSNPTYVPHNGYLEFNYKVNNSSSVQSVLFYNANILGFVGQILFCVAICLFAIAQAICLATCGGFLSYLFETAASILKMNSISHTMKELVSRPSAGGFFAGFKREVTDPIVAEKEKVSAHATLVEMK